MSEKTTELPTFRPYGMEVPTGVKHLHSAMFLVPFDLLQLPDPDGKSTDGYEFRNPRTLTEQGQSVLYDKKLSADMRESIKDKTLMTPFVCRWMRTNDGRLLVQMVGGERRQRAIDFLRRKKELVKDPRSATLNDQMEYEYKYAPADEVYEHVLCQIYAVTDDIEALALAYTENDCRINQGPGNDIAVAMELRQSGATDERIMSVMSKDEKWLRDTDGLISGLPPTVLKELIEDRIDREAAIELFHISEKHGEEIAAQALVVAHEASQKDYKKKFDKLTKSLLVARKDSEIAEGEVTDAEFTGEDVEVAKTKSTEATAKLNRTIKERSKIRPTTEKSHIKDGVKSVQSNELPPKVPSALRGTKIKEHYLDTIESLMKKGGRAESGEFTANIDALSLALKLLKGVAGGDTDAEEIIRLHCKKLSGSGLHIPIVQFPPLPEEEEDDESREQRED